MPRSDVDFRVDGRIFAMLASVNERFGTLMLTPEIQLEFVADAPDVFLPVAGGGAEWMPRTHASQNRHAMYARDRRRARIAGVAIRWQMFVRNIGHGQKESDSSTARHIIAPISSSSALLLNTARRRL
jgi:hypothetical protein